MSQKSQSRKWLLTLNNPLEAGFNHVAIKEIVRKFRPTYFCMADEIATTGTPHTHLFFYSRSPARFSTIKKRFPTAHIEKAYGRTDENRAYIMKSGIWADTDKAETSVPGTFEEWGTNKNRCVVKVPEMQQVIQAIRSGESMMEIIEKHPNYAFKIRELELLRQTILSEKYCQENRKLEVYYLYGSTGTGKTKGVFKENNPREICRITDYGGKNGVHFDAYQHQKVLVFEEFRSQIPISAMLNYLDIYPLTLPARYIDRTACYTKVYITSNIPLEEQYPEVQQYQPKTWQAFLRRISRVVEYKPDGSTVEHEKGGLSA